MKKINLLLLLFVFTSFSGYAIDVQRWQSANNAVVVFYKTTAVPMLTVLVAFKAGSAYDGNHFGLSALTTELLNKGNGRLDTTQIAEQLADTGAQYQAQTTRDMVVLGLKTLTSEPHLTNAAQIFNLIIDQPRFTETSVIQQKNQQLQEIAQSLESPEEVANQLFFTTLYQNHPYAHPINGTKASVLTMNPSIIKEFYHRYFVSHNMTIVLVGNISRLKAENLANIISKNLATGREAPSIPKALPIQQAKTVAQPFPASQTMIRLGQVAISHETDDYFPLIVGNYILGGGTLVSQLSNEVREKRGLTYGITSQFLPLLARGPFIISLSTKNSQASQALKVTKDTLNQFLQNKPSDKDLLAAKRYLVGSFPLALASNQDIAFTLLKTAFYHLPKDYLDKYIENINQVNREDIYQSFKKYININHLVEIQIGKNK